MLRSGSVVRASLAGRAGGPGAISPPLDPHALSDQGATPAPAAERQSEIRICEACAFRSRGLAEWSGRTCPRLAQTLGGTKLPVCPGKSGHMTHDARSDIAAGLKCCRTAECMLRGARKLPLVQPNDLKDSRPGGRSWRSQRRRATGRARRGRPPRCRTGGGCWRPTTATSAASVPPSRDENPRDALAEKSHLGTYPGAAASKER